MILKSKSDERAAHYHRRRARQERMLALTATSHNARVAHFERARLHAWRLPAKA